MAQNPQTPDLTITSRRARLGRTSGVNAKLMYCTLFAVAYLSLIFSTISYVRLSDSLSLMFFVSRSAALIGILIVWAFSSIYTGRAQQTVAIFTLVFLPYVFTGAYIAYLDVLVVLILVTNFRRSGGTEKYYVNLAYASLTLVFVIALMAHFSVIPSTIFTWEGRMKSSMGFSNPNTFFFYIFSSAMVFFAFQRRVAFLLTGVAMLGLYPLVGSRTFMASYLLLAGIWIWPSLIRYRLFILLLWLWLVAVTALGMMTVFSPILATLILTTILGVDANEMLSNRLDLAAQNMMRDTVQFLLGGQGNTADSLYAYFLSGFGLVGFFIFLFWAWTSAARQVYRGSSITLALTAIYFTIGLVEVPFDGSALITMVFFSVAFFTFGEATRSKSLR